MSDDHILEQAALILTEREEARQAEVRRLYRLYACERAGKPHQFGKPKKLLPDEALLLVALEQHHYTAYAECPNRNRWHGDAACECHTRDSVIVMMAASRLDLLWALWASVSDEEKETVILTEAHLQGGNVQADLGGFSIADKSSEIRHVVPPVPPID